MRRLFCLFRFVAAIQSIFSSSFAKEIPHAVFPINKRTRTLFATRAFADIPVFVVKTTGLDRHYPRRKVGAVRIRNRSEDGTVTRLYHGVGRSPNYVLVVFIVACTDGQGSDDRVISHLFFPWLVSWLEGAPTLPPDFLQVFPSLILPRFQWHFVFGIDL